MFGNNIWVKTNHPTCIQVKVHWMVIHPRITTVDSYIPSSGACNPSQKKHLILRILADHRPNIWRRQPHVLFGKLLNSDPRCRQAKDYGQRAIFSPSFGRWFCFARVLDLHSYRYFRLPMTSEFWTYQMLLASLDNPAPHSHLSSSTARFFANDVSTVVAAEAAESCDACNSQHCSVLSIPPERIRESNNLKNGASEIIPVFSGRILWNMQMRDVREHGKGLLIHGVLC